MITSSFKRDRLKAQYYMRGRIAAQFFTFFVLIGGATYMTKKYGKNLDGTQKD